MNQYHKKRGYLYLIVSLFVLFLIVPFNTHNIVQADNYSSEPSAPPKKSFFYWKTSGFKTQPKEKYNATQSPNENSVINIKTKFVRQTKGRSHRNKPKYRWFQSSDKLDWTEIDNETFANLKLKTDKKLDMYYQAVVTYRNVEYHSKIAHVNVFEEERPAKSMHVIADTDYLYSNKENKMFDTSTYVDANLNPDNATGDVQWTLGEFKGANTVPVLQNDLATIDQDGLVTAKPNAEGKVVVTGYVNYNNISIFDQEIIEIGGGLTDVVSHAKQKATFKIKIGNNRTRDSQNDDIKIQWYKIKPNKPNSKVLITNTNDPAPLTMVTPELDESDNGSQYYAVITVPGATHNDDVISTTRKAKLTVKPPLNPSVQIDTSLENKTYNHKTNNELVLDNVASNDSIKYTLTLTNNGLKDLTQPQLKLNFDQHFKIDKINLDGKALETYTVTPLNDTAQSVSIPIDTLTHNKKAVVEISIKMNTINDNGSYSVLPVLSGNYENHKYENEGQATTFNFTDNRIFMAVKNINFQTIMPYEKDVIKYRTNDTNSPNPIVSIYDHRREKTLASLSVKQTQDFINDKAKLDAGLVFFDDSFTPLSIGQEVTVSKLENNQPMKSVSWDSHRGLLLHLNSTPKISGTYQASLEWNITNSVPNQA